jgi:phosphatidate cytidylyltransferase
MENLQNPIVIKSLQYLAIVLLVFGVAILIHIIFKGREKTKYLWVRYLSSLALIPILLIPLFLGRNSFIALVLILSLLSFREYSRSTGLYLDKYFLWSGYLAVMLIYIPVFIDWYGLYTAMPIYCLLAILAIPILRGEFKGMIQKTCLAILGIVYFGWLFSHLAYFMNMQNSIGHIIFILFLISANDAFALLFGKLFGRHKLTPKISPGKTIEGSLGALIVTSIFAYLLRFAIPEFSWWQILVIGPVISISGMFGDLTISFIKRDLNIKDMGEILPGHGGILDRFDSLIFATPIFFHFTRYFFWAMFFNP